jgi:hypothetical protein
MGIHVIELAVTAAMRESILMELVCITQRKVFVIRGCKQAQWITAVEAFLAVIEYL